MRPPKARSGVPADSDQYNFAVDSESQVIVAGIVTQNPHDNVVSLNKAIQRTRSYRTFLFPSVRFPSPRVTATESI